MIYYASMFEEFVDLRPFTTFKLGGKARYFVEIIDPTDIPRAFEFAREKNLSVFILGGGSNILLSHDDVYEAVVIKMNITGFEPIDSEGDKILIKIGAGENWDEAVRKAVDLNLSGIESLSAIPGTAGATPVQNVGAYGTEISDVLVNLDAYDIDNDRFVTLSNADCRFGYRDSIFKNEAKGKSVITAITLQLSKIPGVVPDYPGVKKYFAENGSFADGSQPSLADIRRAIIDIRRFKLPDPREIASVGSFFKNPIVSEEQYHRLEKQFPGIIGYQLPGDRYKIGAGWLLEFLRFKGKQIGNLKFYNHNALVLTNLGDATFRETIAVADQVRQSVMDTFGIELEMEPLVV